MIRIKDRLYSEKEIYWVDLERFAKLGIVQIYLHNGLSYYLENQQALDFVMRHCPDVIEGKRFKFQRMAWAFHNLIAHPLLQILAWLKIPKLGFKIHDSTIPKPRME